MVGLLVPAGLDQRRGECGLLVGLGQDRDERSVAHDLDDAAATAARYLCASGHDLDSGSTWASAIHSYNHAQEYVDAVHAAATAYAQRAAR